MQGDGIIFLTKKEGLFSTQDRKLLGAEDGSHEQQVLSRIYSDENDGAKNRRSTFATGAGELPERLSFLPDVDEAMKQAAVNAILEEDEESDGDVETEIRQAYIEHA